MGQGVPAAPAARRWKGYDEGYAGGGFGDDASSPAATAPVRARTPVNDLDDDIPF